MAILSYCAKDIWRCLSDVGVFSRNFENVVFHASLSSFGALNQAPQEFFTAFLAYFHESTNLFFPVFSYSYRRGKIFNQNVVSRDVFSDMGSLSQLAYRSGLGYQSFCPLFSYYIVGPQASSLSQIRSTHCFGSKSLFGHLFQSDTLFVGLGITYSNGMTPFLYLEKEVGVPFRHDLCIEGTRYIRETDSCVPDSVVHYARNEEDYPLLITNTRESFGEALERRGISSATNLNGGKIYCLYSDSFRTSVVDALVKDPYCMCT